MFMSRLPCITSSTRSGSSLRRSPLLTKTQVSWSPSARWTRVAATAESTPPDSAQITRPAPTRARMLSVASAIKEPAVHDGVQWQTPNRKLRSTSRPLGVCTTSGWNWVPKIPLPSVKAAYGELPLVARTHPDRQLALHAPKETVRLTHREERRPVLKGAAGVDLAAEVVGDELHAVADSEHRDARSQRRGVHVRGSGVVDACRPAAQDQAGRVSLLQLRPRRRAGHELAVDVGLAHASRDQLAELRAEIEDEDRLLARGQPGWCFPPSCGGAAQDFPIPTCWACWNTLPSETIAGATTISTCWNWAMSLAPHTPSAERSAPAKFCDPSSTRAGPSRISRSVAFVPTWMRVPRGRFGSGVAMPQLKPFDADSSAPASGVPIMTASAPAANALHTSAPIRMPPSVMTATRMPPRRMCSSRAAATSAVAVTCGTPTPSTPRVVHAAPGPTPTRMPAMPVSISSSAVSYWTQLPTTTGISQARTSASNASW